MKTLTTDYFVEWQLEMKAPELFVETESFPPSSNIYPLCELEAEVPAPLPEIVDSKLTSVDTYPLCELETKATMVPSETADSKLNLSDIYPLCELEAEALLLKFPVSPLTKWSVSQITS